MFSPNQLSFLISECSQLCTKHAPRFTFYLPSSKKLSLPSLKCCLFPESLSLFSPSVMSDSLRPNGLQHARLPCPSPSPRACSNSSPSSWINHLILGHSLLLLPLIFPRIRVFSNQWALHIRWPKYWSFSFSISPIQERFPLGCTGWISFLSKGLLRVFSNTTVQKHQFFGTQLSL